MVGEVYAREKSAPSGIGVTGIDGVIVLEKIALPATLWVVMYLERGRRFLGAEGSLDADIETRLVLLRDRFNRWDDAWMQCLN